MDLNFLFDALGEREAIAFGGLLIGALFGYCAQRSSFCLRAATIEFGRREFGTKVAIWLLAFAAALVSAQGMILAGWLDVSSARQLAARGSLSGAIIGGALFGAGMILARGCASRLLVVSATGNLRALLSGLIFAVAAQASLRGVLSPLRNWIAGLWTIDGGARDLLALTHLGKVGGLIFGLCWLVAAFVFARRASIVFRAWLGGLGVGLAVALAWFFTYQASGQAFEPVAVQSLSFTGPSADVLMLVLSPPGQPFDFNIGMLPGVFLGAFLGAWQGRELKLEGFQGGLAMRRYLAGAVLMGFGGMLAGGCAVGAGVSGAAIFALTAWVTLFSMWGAAMLTDYLVDQPARAPGASQSGELQAPAP